MLGVCGVVWLAGWSIWVVLVCCPKWPRVTTTTAAAATTTSLTMQQSTKKARQIPTSVAKFSLFLYIDRADLI